MAAQGICTPARTNIAGGLAGLPGNVVNNVLAWYRGTLTRVALNKLSDHELEDIGLTRGDINVVAAQYNR